MTTAADIVGIPDAQDLARMLSAYTEVTERLRSSHDRLAAEVGRLRGELASKNRQLERRSRLAALGEMAAGMAHEIRNPLGGIALYAGLLRKQLEDRPAQQALAARIACGVEGLNAIVNDILAFAGEIQPQKRPVDLASVVHEACDLARARLEQSGADLACDVPEGTELAADRSLLVRAVSNLLFNAIDAAGEGEIRLAGRIDGDRVVLTVADSGPGVPAENLERIFNPFFTTKDAGTGLGLAIVHRIVESHGGQIGAANAAAPEGLGGALFTISLPRR